MKRFYRVDEDDEEAEEETEENTPESRIAYLNRMARGEMDSDESSSDSSDSDDEVEAKAQEDNTDEEIPMGDATRRMAIMNCDWDRIRAVDLFVLLQSFAPASGIVENVTIYPSDYGLKKMAEEEEFGPQELWKGEEEEKPTTEEEEEDDEEEDDEDPLGTKATSTEESFDPEKLRKYELQKLKYYYAVVTCDSVKTSAALYDQCDQYEYETSSNNLDLRFIPDEMEFKNEAKDTCTCIPEDYKPNRFVTSALQRTDVELTWEQEDEDRRECLTRVRQWKEMEDKEFSAFIASDASSAGEGDESDSQENVERLRQKYRKALLGSDSESDSGDKANNDDDEGDMEMSFTPGLGEDLLERRKEKALEAEETPYEAYRRSKGEEKKRKRADKRQKKKEEERDMQQVLKKSRSQLRTDQKQQPISEELTELVGQDVLEVKERDFNMNEIVRKDRLADKKLRGKRRKKEEKRKEKVGGLQDGFEIDVEDKRFSALYDTSASFGIDPTDSRFKKTAAMEKILSQRRKKKDSSPVSTSNDTSSTNTRGLADLVASVKRKTGKVKPSK